jgi:large repetitive protein
MDLFLILTPFLLLVIVSLLGFVGCTAFAGVDSVPFSITTTSPLPQALVDVPYSLTMAASGGTIPYHWTIVAGAGGLPAGLTMNDAGVISGTPTDAAKTYSLTINVTDSPIPPDPGKPAPSPSTATQAFNLSLVLSPPPQVNAITPSSGPTGGGTAITVGGSNFLDKATLALDGVPASGVMVASSTSIKAISGAHAAGAVDVVVTNPDGQFGALPKAFTYIAAPTGVTHSGVTDIATPSGVSTAILSAVIPLPGALSKLIIVTVAWGGGGTLIGGAPTFVSGGGGATFQAVAGVAPWNGMKIQTFFANGVPPGSVQVKVQFTVASPGSPKLCTSAYDNAAPGNPTYTPVATPNGKAGTTLQSAAPINANPLDLVYAVGFAATSAGVFPGGMTITPGAGFTAEPGPGNPLVEDHQITAAGSVTPKATNSTGGATSLWFMFAMGIKRA